MNGEILLHAVGRAAFLRDYCFGIKPGQSDVMYDPVYPHHNAPRRCEWCGEVHRRHAGWTDRLDEHNPTIPTRRGPSPTPPTERDDA